MFFLNLLNLNVGSEKHENFRYDIDDVDLRQSLIASSQIYSCRIDEIREKERQ